MNLIYYRESGKKGHCGECSSCKRHNSELGYNCCIINKFGDN